MVTVIDGKAHAEKIIDEMKAQIRGRTLPVPELVFVSIGSNPVSDRYVRVKERVAETLGVPTRQINLSADVPFPVCRGAIEDLAKNPQVGGIVIQLPLPSHIYAEKLFEAIPGEKDPDALTARATVVPPVARAVLSVLSTYNISLPGAMVAVVGGGKLVGQPVAKLLRGHGAHVTVIEKETPDPASVARQADIVVSGVGLPGLVTADWISSGAFVVDAGTSESSGRLVGDVSPDAYSRASFVVPVPNGVGPVAVAMLYANYLELIEKK